jgi:hypothetical protein
MTKTERERGSERERKRKRGREGECKIRGEGLKGDCEQLSCVASSISEARSGKIFLFLF